ncbi:TonB-dependent receptor [Brevundimonas sp.]|uniref:TonB-dependent receptor n=1 Tax=Brevundimonas sp. TaxID=1871086 RepID=UPI001A240D21|nr:TonB-dependent receptor [Brevundimonas sp.]MBJ7486269.1 TonB-dependent receptor [Brevundimonas sp.]
MTIAAAILYALASGSLQTAPAPTTQTAPAQPAPSQAAPTQEPVIEAPAEPEAAPVEDVPEDAVDLGELDSVAAAKPRGSVQGDIAPDVVLDANQIKAYGASNIAELLTNLEPLTRSSSGRSDQGPIILLNGRRTSGFQEIQGIPIEAIERTEILPEQVALTYGFAADRRVVNIVIKAAFRQASVNLRTGGPSQGGRLASEVAGNFFNVQAADRWNVDVVRQHDTALFESERDITRAPGSQPFDLIGNLSGSPYGTAISPSIAALVAAVPTGGATPTAAQIAAGANAPRTGNLSDYRTLLPRRDQSTVRASLARDLNTTTKATLSGSLDDTSTEGFGGLAGIALTLPGGSPFTPFANDTRLYRFVDDPSALLRNTDTLTGNAALLIDGYLGDWRYSLSGSMDYVETESTVGRGYDASALQLAINQRNPAFNPFADLPLALLTPLSDTSRSVASGANTEGVLTGRLWDGPAGNLQSTFKFGLDTRRLESESLRSGVASETDLDRQRAYGSFNLSMPLTSTRREFLPAFGDLSVSLNGGYDEYSDFGGLRTLGAGVNWAPKTFVSFNVNYSNEQGPPTINQLNDPVLATVNTPVYDFRTNQTVNVTYITGGNPNLTSDNRQVLRAGFNLTPFQSMNLSFQSTYTYALTDDAITGFPTITPDLEAALPSRFTRDAAGTLLSVDARPLNYTKTERQDVRTGFNFSRPFGTPSAPAAGSPMAVMGAVMGGGGGRPGGGGGGGGPQVRIQGGGPGGGGGGGGFGGGRGGPAFQPGQGIFNLSVYYTYRIQDEILIRDGLAVIDQLDGGATGGRGGTPRSEVQVQGGAFRNGMGMFVNANWRDGTRVDGGLTGSDLTFSSQATVGLNVFVDANQRPGLLAKYPWLKGTRISLGVDNLFDTRLNVRSATGDVPLNYQPDFLDPQGRVIRINLRKVLF